MSPENHFDQQIRLHPAFSDYSLPTADSLANPMYQDGKSHEAGFDALMTGVVWYKLRSILAHPIKREFPGVEEIQSNNLA